MSLKEAAILYKVNEYLKKPDIRKMLVGKIIEASEDPKFKEFLKEDIEKTMLEMRMPKGLTKISPAKKEIVMKQAVPDKAALKQATKEILKELEQETKLKKKHRTFGEKLIGPLLQTKILDFRLRDLYTKQKGFAWTSSITLVCFVIAFLTKLNNQLLFSRIFLGIGTGFVAGGILIYYFYTRTYKNIFGKEA